MEHVIVGVSLHRVPEALFVVVIESAPPNVIGTDTGCEGVEAISQCVYGHLHGGEQNVAALVMPAKQLIQHEPCLSGLWSGNVSDEITALIPCCLFVHGCPTRRHTDEAIDTVVAFVSVKSNLTGLTDVN